MREFRTTLDRASRNATRASMLAGPDRRALAEPRGGRLRQAVRSLPDSRGEVLGEVLPAAIREPAERGMGHDFGSVRVHHDAAAASAADQLGARAWTVGSDIFFAGGRFAPELPAGDRLLVHELTHVMMQARSREPSIQCDTEGSNTAGLVANEIVPYPVGARVQVVNLIRPNVLQLAATFADAQYKDLIAALSDDEVAKNLIAIIGESTADKVSLSIDTPPIPAKGSRSAIAAFHVAMDIVRNADGTFQADIVWSGPSQGARSVGFTAARGAGGGVVLSVPGEDPRVSIGPADKAGQRIVRAENLPRIVRWAAGDPLELVALHQTTARAGSVEETKEIAATASSARERVAEKKQQVSLGLGVQHGYQFDPLLTAGWRFTFTPLAKAVQFPVVLQLDYVPPKSLLAGAAGGIQVAIPTKVPVEVHVLGGLKGGVLGQGGPDISRADRELKPVFGPTLGLGGSIELGSITVGLDAEYLWNLVKGGPNVTKVGLSAALAF